MEILSKRAAAAAANVCERTLDRLFASGLGPPRITITKRRCGYEKAAFEQWLRDRTFSSQAAALVAGLAIPQPPQLQKRKRVAAEPPPAVPATDAATAAPRDRYAEEDALMDVSPLRRKPPADAAPSSAPAPQKRRRVRRVHG